jgi:hypothetical protein
MNRAIKVVLLSAATLAIVAACENSAYAWNCPPPNADIHCTSDEATYDKSGCPAGSCPTMTPTPSPSATVAPTPTTTPTSTPTTSTAPPTGSATPPPKFENGDDSKRPTLPFTGDTTGWLLIAGSALVAGGAGAKALSRKGAHR